MKLPMKVVCAFWSVLFIGVALGGVYSASKQMSQMAGGLFVFNKETHCAENAFYIGKYGGGGVDDTSAGAYSHNTTGPDSFFQQYYLPACEGPTVDINCAQITS